jgi:transcriptional regulator with XRE-family HTH domain
VEQSLQVVGQSPHWTEASADDFVHRIIFDFIAQVEKKMESMPLTQAELAKRLDVSEGAVSRILNNPHNLTLKTIVRYARALGIKVSVVAYDDGDPYNTLGPVNSEIFSICWQQAGSPHDNWSVDSRYQAVFATQIKVHWFTEQFVLALPGYGGYGIEPFGVPYSYYVSAGTFEYTQYVERQIPASVMISKNQYEER